AHELAVVSEVIVQALHHHVLLEPGHAADARQIDLGSATEGQQSHQLVLAHTLPDEGTGVADCQRHVSMGREYRGTRRTATRASIGPRAYRDDARPRAGPCPSPEPGSEFEDL